MSSRYQLHVAKWSNCKKCSLSEGRTKVVIARGSIPCEVLFIGEVPGESEDAIGVPFIGPAGKLLDHIVSKALGDTSYAMTNIVCCIPRDEDGGKTAQPDDSAIRACADRLAEFIWLSAPKLVVCVGSLAASWVRRLRTGLGLGDKQIVDIVHPAAILRSNIAQQGLAIQRAVVVLTNAMEGIQ